MTTPRKPARRSAATLAAPVAGRQTQLTNALAFMRLLWAVDHRLRSLSKQMQASIGLTGPQRLVLRILGKFSAITPSEVADLLHLDRGTLSGVLERLSTQQLLVRTRSEEDGRSVLLELTARGRLLDQETPGTVEACVRRALASMSREQIEAAKQVLEAVARELAREDQRDDDSA